MTEKTKPTKRQHFIPQVYLRGFSSNKKTVYAAILGDSLEDIIFDKEVPIDSVCRENYLYEFKDEKGENVAVNYVEKQLGQYEELFYQYRNSILKKAYNKKNYNIKSFLSSKEKTFWRFWISLQILRYPSVISNTSIFTEKYFHGKLDDIQSKNFILLNTFNISTSNQNEAPILKSMMSQFCDMSFEVGVSENMAFLTADFPMDLCRYKDYYWDGNCITYPLNSEIIIRLFDPKRGKRHINRLYKVEKAEAEKINSYIAFAAQKMIFYKEPIGDYEKNIIVNARKSRLEYYKRNPHYQGRHDKESLYDDVMKQM